MMNLGRIGRGDPMRRGRLPVTLALAVLALGLMGSTPPGIDRNATYQAEVRRTQGGIPHVLARDFASLGFGSGYAMAQDNLCLMADEFLTLSAQRSLFLGPQDGNLESDFFYQLLIDRGEAEEPVSPEQTAFFRGAAAGYNAYLRETGVDQIPDPACRGVEWVREITDTDFRRKSRTEFILPFFLKLIVAAAPPTTLTSTPTPVLAGAMAALDSPVPADLGSNGVALGRDATVNGHGMLLANPHQPWFGPARFHAIHETLPTALNIMGANQISRPQVGFGATEHVAWTSTVSVADRFSFYLMKLDPSSPTTYLFDGQPQPMTLETVLVTIRNPDNTTELRTHDFYMTQFGAYMVGNPFLPWASTIAFAARFAPAGWRGMEALLPQYQARSVHEFKQVHDRYEFLPVNLIAADSTGETLYSDPGPVPDLTDAQLDDCTVLGFALDGARSACQWGADPNAAVAGILAPENLPYLFRTDYVTNSNDSYWLSNPGEPLTGFRRVLGENAVGTARTLRTRSGLQMVQQRLDGTDGLGAPGFTLEQLQQLMLSDQNLAGQLLRDGLVQLCDANPNVTLPDSTLVDISEACPILAAWDLHADLDSRGAHVFREFLRTALGEAPPGGSLPPLPDSFDYLIPFDANDPIHTPRGLAATNNPDALQALATSVKMMRDAGLPLDARLGDLQSVTRNADVIPLHGGPNFEGVFNVIRADFQGSAGYPEVTASSSSWIQATEFSEQGPVIRALLTYSMSASPESPYFSDQTQLFSQKQWVSIPFRYGDVETSTLEVISLTQSKDDCKNGGWADFEALQFANQGECSKYLASLRHERLVEIDGRRDCANTLSKSLAKVVKIQGKETARCLKDASKGVLAGTIQGCSESDPKGKVAKAQGQTNATADKKCGRTTFDFGGSDAATVNQAGIELESGLLSDLFGSELDSAIVQKSSDAATSACQLGLVKAVDKCRDTWLKEYAKCKKERLGDESVVDAIDLEACVGADPKQKIAKACDLVANGGKKTDKIRSVVTKKCIPKGVDLMGAFPGCTTPDAEDFHDCASAAVACRICRMLNRADGLADNCDQLDDGSENGSCP